MNIRHTLLTCSLLIACASAQGQTSVDSLRARDAEWMSYRDAYRSILIFEKYGKPKNLIQNHLQVVSKDKNLPIESVRLSLIGKTSQFFLPLDATGRAAMPLHKSAYDENAELVLNLKQGQAKFRIRVSIVVRADGVYEMADLRNACEQVLAYQSYAEPFAYKGKKCVGVNFAFNKKEQAALVELRTGNQVMLALKMNEDTVLWEDSALSFKTAPVFFSVSTEKNQIYTHTTPVIITAILE